ncbi:type II toxin-antitoxin system VapC family toxin, partial [Xanthomonas citri pv. citri]
HITSYWLRKAYGATKTKEILISLLDAIYIIDCDHAVTLLALHSKMNDVEDSLQYFTALKFGLDYFISSDKELKNVAMQQLPVYFPEEFLKLIS